MIDQAEPQASPIPSGWQRIGALLDRMGSNLVALEAKSELIGPEVLASLREDHAALHSELLVLSGTVSEPSRGVAPRLADLRDRASRFSASMSRGARRTYIRLRTRASGSRINPALKDSLSDLGSGTVRAWRELAGAMAAAVGRFRKPKPADTPPRIEAPSRAPDGGAAAGNH